MSRARVDMWQMGHAFAWEKEGWFAPLSALLEGLGPAEAAWQPPGGGNSIWQTINHLNYYNERYLQRMKGEPVGPAPDGNDVTFAAGNPEDAAAWAATVAKTREVADGYSKLLAEMTDDDLDKPFGQGTVAGVLPALITHMIYHTGQIALIRKMQQSWPARRDG